MPIRFLFLTATLLAASCGQQPSKPLPGPSLSEKILAAGIPDFNSDSAYHFVATQVAFGPRVPNTESHARCARYLESTLARFAEKVQVQEARIRAYNGQVLNIKNIIGSFAPAKPNRILLCAHWDSRPYADHDPNPANHYKPIPGANDGASGVGVLLEIARQLSMKQHEFGIDIVFFDAEDYGEHQSLQGNREDTWALGSQYWARNPHIAGYRARFGILLDMVGAADAVFTMEGTSMQYAPDVMRKVWNTAHAIGYSAYFSMQQTSPLIDDHLFINRIARIPTIDIIHFTQETPTGFFADWHTMRDDMRNIDRNTMKAVGQTVLTVIGLEK